MSYQGRQTTIPLDALAVATCPVRMINRKQVSPAETEAAFLICVYLDDGVSEMRQLKRRLRKLYSYRYEQGIPVDDFPHVVILTASY